MWVAEAERVERAPDGREPVGAFLRRQREGRGWTLEDVSAALRIPMRHLHAIEESVFAALPGHIYAVGFLRSYAELVGADPAAIVARYKSEAGIGRHAPELVFPEPVTERRLPGGAIAAVGVCLAVVVYSGWYYRTAQQIQREAMAPVPLHLAATADPTFSGQEPSAQPGSPTLRVAVGRPETGAGVPAASAPAPRAERPENRWSDRRDAGRLLASAGPTAPAVRGEAGSASEADRRGGAAPQGWVARTPAATAPPLPSASMIGSLEVKLPGEGSAWAPVMRGAAPAQAAEVNGARLGWGVAPAREPGPVVLNAVEASWIEIRGEGGEVVHAKLMKPGDTYTMPDRPGLKLTTGNAGGLEILVGGQPAPRLGPRGAVLREVPADPARLLAGTAGRH